MTAPRSDERFLSVRGSPVLIFRVLLVGITLSTAVGITYAVVQRAAFQAGFPGATDPLIYAGFLTVAAVALAALAGLWFWKRWAVVLYAGVALASVVLDIVAGAPGLHQLTVVVGAVAVFLLVAANRDRFRGRGV